MTIDLEVQLRDYAVHVGSLSVPVNLEEVLEQRTGPGPVRPLHVREAGRRPPRWLYGVAAALVALLLVGGVALLVQIGGEDESRPVATTAPAPDPTTPSTVTAPSTPTTIAAPNTPTPPPSPPTTAGGSALVDVEAAAVDAIAGAGTMLIHHGSPFPRGSDSVDDLLPPQVETDELLSAVGRDVYLRLAPLPETRLQEGAVWIGSLPDATTATLVISEIISAFREAADPALLPTSEFEVQGIGGARGFLVRWLTGRGGPSSSPNAIVWFQVGNVVAAVDVNVGGDFATAEWPME